MKINQKVKRTFRRDGTGYQYGTIQSGPIGYQNTIAYIVEWGDYTSLCNGNYLEIDDAEHEEDATQADYGLPWQATWRASENWTKANDKINEKDGE